MLDSGNGIYGGVEAGGTKFVCALGTGPDDIRAEIRFPTTTPAETLSQVVAFFKDGRKYGPLAALGVASFGPVDLNKNSKTFGFITNTPKPGWAMTDFTNLLSREFQVPVGFDTDVNGAALGEYRWGVGVGLDSILYLTVGTGIGGGAVADGKIIHGLLHPEMGHIRIPHDLVEDPYPGCCPYHADCFEGLACGPAIQARWGVPAQNLPVGHPGWELEAKYLAYALVNYSLVISPQRLILGGGVMNQPGLFDKVRFEFKRFLNGYIQKDEVLGEIENFIVPPGLGGRAGVLGAIALAQNAKNSG
jgi:fructokinase